MNDGGNRNCGAVRLPEDSQLVVDADEEVFLIYSDLQGGISPYSGEFRGLGQQDSHHDVLTVQLDLCPPMGAPPVPLPRAKSSRHSSKRPTKLSRPAGRTIEISVAQDVTALRSRNGDTGSVVWKASIDFARLVLEQLHFAAPTDSLFDKTTLRDMAILELGAGTGLLSMALSPWVRNYTVTDTSEILPLLEKNVSLNCAGSPDTTNISIAELDWLSLHATPSKQRSRAFQFPAVDLVFVVDCIYHPSLMPALVDTIDYVSTPGRTTVMVVIELRDEDAVRLFLELWLGRAGWEIYRIGRSNGLPRPYMIWVGRKVDGHNSQEQDYEDMA
ncbi:putative methyltransferase-domain-containing protein [Desarmillaria tabescens]|uniref:Methyltransferase-domain-containing protein n=1 Tax=Armillaria tabescens TaxID=1929756 RepID=A0AA39N4Q6_ARMTA|nr:putative methyltransferase-domain-containing protein [Desarmillaria tabescens]KAK0457832.1 putative methyltransferase-domain-containing protein [Desarmillaria tabescens]